MHIASCVDMLFRAACTWVHPSSLWCLPYPSWYLNSHTYSLTFSPTCSLTHSFSHSSPLQALNLPQAAWIWMPRNPWSCTSYQGPQLLIQFQGQTYRRRRTLHMHRKVGRHGDVLISSMLCLNCPAMLCLAIASTVLQGMTYFILWPLTWPTFAFSSLILYST